MIPISPRARERNAIQGYTFSYDATAVERLESAVGDYHGCPFAVAFNTPESAIRAALSASGTFRYDRLITGAMAPLHHYTAAATTAAELHYCDISLDGNLYAKALRSLASERTAVLSAAFEGIRPVRPNLEGTVMLVDDASASLSPVRVTDNTVWSLASVMPEGIEKTGFVLTNDADTAIRLKQFRERGRKNALLWNYDLMLHGADTALSDLAASVALKQMPMLHAACERRRAHASRLDEKLRGSALFDLVKRKPDDTLRSYPLLLTPQLYCSKEDIFSAVRDKGVEAWVCCKPVYKTTAFRNDALRLPVTEDFYKALLQLPCHHRLSETEADTVATALLEAVAGYAYRGCRF